MIVKNGHADPNKLQSIKRTDSDSKYKEADDILKEIDALKAKE